MYYMMFSCQTLMYTKKYISKTNSKIVEISVDEAGEIDKTIKQRIVVK